MRALFEYCLALVLTVTFREISHGQFTTDNHLPVRGSNEYIPLYRARLSNDLRIIYLIDLMADGQNKVRFLLDSGCTRWLNMLVPSLIIKVRWQMRVAPSLLTFCHLVIKVFSVSSRARVAYEFWVKVSKFLAQHGTEYRHR